MSDKISAKYVVGRRIIEMRNDGLDDQQIRESLKAEGYDSEMICKGVRVADKALAGFLFLHDPRREMKALMKPEESGDDDD